MDTLVGFLGSAVVVLFYAWAVGTFLWMLIVVPRMHKRQAEIMRRLNALEKGLSELDSREFSP
jgi:hypothetical protein